LPLRRGSLEALPHDGGYLPFIILVGQRDRPGNIGIADLIVCSCGILLIDGQGFNKSSSINSVTLLQGPEKPIKYP